MLPRVFSYLSLHTGSRMKVKEQSVFFTNPSVQETNPHVSPSNQRSPGVTFAYHTFTSLTLDLMHGAPYACHAHPLPRARFDQEQQSVTWGHRRRSTQPIRSQPMAAQLNQSRFTWTATSQLVSTKRK